MTDLNGLKQLWQEPRNLPATRPMSKEELMALLQAKAADVKTRILRRVREEIQTYLIVLMIPILVLLLRHGISVRGLVWFALLVLMGLTIAALSYKEYQIRSLPLHGTLREALTSLTVALDSMTRLYMAAYMTSVVISVACGEAFLIWRQGLTILPLLGLAVGTAFVVWCYKAGRLYLQRNFGSYRTELMNCLNELESG